MGSIGSAKVYDIGNCSLFQSPSGGILDELQEMLVGIMDDVILAKIEALQATSSKGVSKEFLSKIWTVSEELAQGAIDQNSQLCKHHADNGLSRNFSTNDRMLRYKHLKSVFYTDNLLSQLTKSTRGNIYEQMFVIDKGFVVFYPMKSQSEFQSALHWFCKEVGVPSTLVMDGHKA